MIMIIPSAKNTTGTRELLLEVKERQVRNATTEKRSSSHNLMLEHRGEIVQQRKHEERHGDFRAQGASA